MTCPVLSAAPISRARISPDRLPVRSTLTGTGSLAQYSSSSFPRKSVNDKVTRQSAVHDGIVTYGKGMNGRTVI